jgi:DNA-binding NtrC family response regulator
VKAHACARSGPGYRGSQSRRDYSLLVEHFIQEFNREHNKNVQGMGQDCLDTLRAHTWPGNVRELRNVVQRAVIKCHSPMLSAGDLPKEAAVQRCPNTDFTILLGSSICEVERELIVRTIAYAKGNKARAADILEMSRRNLYNRLQSYARRDVDGRLDGHGYHNGRNGKS